MPIILGSGGMLGSMVAKVLPNADTLDRPDLDAENPPNLAIEDRIVNCIGIIKPYCNDVVRAIKVNALFPHYLPEGTIQIATDCVFSGALGNYIETDAHDATDVYGQTKSLGEAPQLNNLRCSIIGPELKNHLSLLDWFLAQKGSVNGFTNHRWNGITTYHFGLIVKGILGSSIQLPAIQHIVPADSVDKRQLLEIIAKEFKHKIKIKPVEASEKVDRTLSTNDPDLNLRLWQLAGYDKPPTIHQMIKELAALK